MGVHEGGAVRILLIEDDPETAEYVVEGLQGEGHDLQVAADGRTGLISAAAEAWDLLIVDRMLPGLDGLALVRTLRASGIVTPALFLTTMGGIDDRVNGLNAGGDDYLVKPFAFAELGARVAALGRRARYAPRRRQCCGWPIWRWICWRARCVAVVRQSSCNRASSSCCNT
jgi:two-component system, OmpR family, response regulator